MKMGRAKTYKKCPRCGEKCLLAQERCNECNLLFSRLEYASNKAAKKKLLRFDRDFIIYTNQLPKDVKRWKLILFSILLGLFGGHYYYVGKYIKGALMTLSFAYLVCCTIFNAQIVALESGELLFFPVGIAAFAWIVGMSLVLCKKFKVPVIVDMPKSEVVE